MAFYEIIQRMAKGIQTHGIVLLKMGKKFKRQHRDLFEYL